MIAQANYDQFKSYSVHQRNDESVRETEAHALLNCASRLEFACQPECPRQDFMEAIRYNQKLWTVFQSCLCDKSNPLPRDLKTLLLNLSVYIDKTSFRAMAEHNARYLQSLIKINRNLAAGLSVKSKADTKALSDKMPSLPTGPIETTA